MPFKDKSIRLSYLKDWRKRNVDKCRQYHDIWNQSKEGYQSRRKWLLKRPELRIFYGIVQRTTNPKCSIWKYYGGRGIMNKLKSYRDIINAIGFRPGPAYSIDRINNDGHYEKGNIRWATRSQQELNKRSLKWQPQ